MWPKKHDMRNFMFLEEQAQVVLMLEKLFGAKDQEKHSSLKNACVLDLSHSKVFKVKSQNRPL